MPLSCPTPLLADLRCYSDVRTAAGCALDLNRAKRSTQSRSRLFLLLTLS